MSPLDNLLTYMGGVSLVLGNQHGTGGRKGLLEGWEEEADKGNGDLKAGSIREFQKGFTGSTCSFSASPGVASAHSGCLLWVSMWM